MLKRTHHCNAIRPDHVGETVVLAGWVNTYETTQARWCSSTSAIAAHHPDRLRQAPCRRRGGRRRLGLRREDVIAVRGVVRTRGGGANPKLETGEVEVLATELEILNKAETPPILPDDQAEKIGEETRLKNRYLDLRRPKMQRILEARSRVRAVHPPSSTNASSSRSRRLSSSSRRRRMPGTSWFRVV